ncbi:predicted protein [Micromonas commoda]|uniref:Uncharacterized protein n=1 Tax=Micromonas commoda (strain RCC299 / NOUM17 / CCMP2709) TaxID=296587 RepID=C1E1F6_MICCC|nr:predicted protein [Micromonas commoda]ACO61730.1 predicted protein [Micromonas commoda]|eukprot:XP_002500472.1 predicted protein [Micromonas commoda]
MEPRGEAIGGTPPQRSERRFGVLGPQRIDRDGVGFASHENLAEVVPYLNRSLNDLGYPGPLELEAPSVGDLARVANVLFLILRDRQQDAASREQWGRERRRLAADKARAETFYERARAELAAKDEELANSLAKSDGRVDKERRRLDDATAECASLKQRLLKSQQRCATLENESRRREKEREKLSARLEKFVNDRRRDVANATPVGVMRVTTGGPDDVGPAVEQKVSFGGLNAANATSRVPNVHATGRHKTVAAAAATSKAAALDAAARVAASLASPFVSQELHHQMMGAYEAKMRSLMHDVNDLRELLAANGVDPETGERIGDPERRQTAGGYLPSPAEARGDLGGAGPDAMASGAMALGDVEDETAAAARDAALIAAATEAEIGVGDDAFTFNLGALRRRLGDDGSARSPPRGFGATTTTTTTRASTERLPTAPPAALASGRAAPNETQPAGALASGGSAGSVPSAGAPSPIEVALAWHEREHARLRGVLSHPPRELRDAPTPELAFEVEKTILSPAKSAASGGGGGVAAAREDLRGAVAAARAAAAKASPARQQLHWNEPPSPARAPAPIYESSPSVSSAEEDDDAPTPRTTPPTPAFGAAASRAYDNPMADDAADLDGEELAREAAAAAAEREAEAAAAVFAERVDRAFNSVQHEASRGSIDDAGEDLVELDVGLMADDDDDVYVADDDSHVQRVQREAAGTPTGRVTVEPRSDTIAAFVDGSRRLPEFEGVGERDRGGAFGSPADVPADRTTGRPEAGVSAGAGAGADFGARMAQLSTPRAQPPAPAAVAPPSPAPPASPLDELLARHLKLGRGRPTAGGGEGDAKEDWRERYRRRRANPFASFAANDAKLAVDASQQTPGFAMLHSG